jgi:branched-chain amino acid transport system substrate-binding protein
VRRLSIPWRLFAAVPCVIASLLVSGCQTADLPLLGGSTKPAPRIQVQVPQQAVPPAPRTAEPAPPPPPPNVVMVPAVPPLPPAPIAVTPLLDTLPPPQAPATPPTLLPAPKAPKEESRAALLVPLSGPNAALGNALANAAQLALFDIADQHFNLIPLDTHGTPDGAAAAARLAISQGADIILGPLFSAEVKAVSPIAHEQGIPVIALTTDRSAIGNGTYSLGFLPGQQIRRVVMQAKADNRTRFAVLAPNTEYGRAMADAMKAVVLETGVRLVRLEFYEPTASDLTPVAKRFAEYERHRADLQRDKAVGAGRSAAKDSTPVASTAMPYDAVLLPDEGTRLKSIASLITYYGLDPGPVRFLGTMLWDDPRLADEPSLQGGWYPAPPAAGHAEFEQRYLKAFGPLPARSGPFASAAYDATALAAALARQGQGDFSAAALTNPNGFGGIDGIFRLLPDGTSERGLAVREIARGGNIEVSPAPGSFAETVTQ